MIVNVLGKNWKFTLHIAAKSIARYKDLELSYRTIIEDFIKGQKDLKAGAREDS